MNIRKRAKLDFPVTAMSGDIVSVVHESVAVGPDGKVEVLERTTFVEDSFTEQMTFDEAAIIEGELEDRRYIGGILIEKK